ncbi:PIN/TRAM domain-containing protein [Miniphocaeibacter halophilus]|uniref:TRAM domain-containing protein n=1 Tax=Miniphocaeibacter halophilus TaxID=2931922 RepID=A0AC61MPC5_9FIRM|nr:PIN domain-containing protein [Miniphocaeibacter halophilus]QQK07387.1 TRAM domain-containing protein [Miniphocaeibacter halophilus]
MAKKVFNIFMILLGGICGFTVVYLLDKVQLLSSFEGVVKTVIYVIGIILFSIIFYLIFPKIIKGIDKSTKNVESEIAKLPISEVLLGVVGMIIGLIVALLVSYPLLQLELPYVGNIPMVILSIIIFISLGYLGLRVGRTNKSDLNNTFQKMRISKDKVSKKTINESIKILDTSVIIDGRIKDIIEAGFIEGKIIVPIFVLEELQHIADSDNDLRRQKGRRGLDILKLIQNITSTEVEISQKRYSDIEEVDSKILQLAKELKGKVITNDYNLNKVATVRDIEVLNINELANAMKPIVIPGEQMTVTILKDGKEANQGLAYLEDGTMIVIEDGKNYIGKTVETTVTSVLQTAAGKMIFVRINLNNGKK